MMDLLRALEETRAHLHGHFSLSSGLHSDQYFQCAKLLEHPRLAQQVGQELAARFEGTQVDLVVSPALGGILIGHEVAKALGVRFLFGERYGEERKLTLRRGFQVQPGEKILLVEDVITTGGSVLELKRLVESQGGSAAAYGAIVDRRAEEIDLGLRLEALVKIQVNVYKPEECPLCREKIPVTKPGSRDLVAK
jgi:orotate phosphoribosyltransferase